MQIAAIFLGMTLSVVAQAATWDDRMFAGDRYRQAGQYSEAAESYRAAMSAAGDERQHAITANNLAALCGELRQYDEARRLYRQALDTWQRTLAPGAREIATTLNNMGALYAAEHRYKDAAWYYKRALEISPLPNTLNNLAEMYRVEGRFTQAEKLFQQLIASLPEDDPTLGTALNNLGELYRIKGRSLEAGRLYRRALAVWERTLGPDHPYKAATLQNLALLEGGRKSGVSVQSFAGQTR